MNELSLLDLMYKTPPAKNYYRCLEYFISGAIKFSILTKTGSSRFETRAATRFSGVEVATAAYCAPQRTDSKPRETTMTTVRAEAPKRLSVFVQGTT